MPNFYMVLFTVILTFINVSAQDERAAEIIKEARKALGGQKLEALQNVTAKGKLSESFAEGETREGKFEFTLSLPDKFLKAETKTVFGHDEITEIQAMNGTDEWFDVKTPNAPGGAGGGNVFFRREPESPAAVSAEKSSIVRQLATRFFLGMFAATPAGFPVEFSFAGTAQSSDGTVADVLNVKGESFNAQLFIDQKTHLPLMISYQDAPPMMRIARAPVPGGQMLRRKIDKNDKKPESNRDEVKLAAEMPQLPPVNFQLIFEDFREIDGVRLPHRITESMDGKAVKEWSFTAYKLNTSVKPEIFTRKKS